MKRFAFFALNIMALSLVAVPSPAEARPACAECRENRPYGGYCTGPRWGWYGSRMRVDSPGKAREILEKFFAADKLAVGRLSERDFYYEADMLDQKGKLVDRVIVDKRNGRIRSIY